MKDVSIGDLKDFSNLLTKIVGKHSQQIFFSARDIIDRIIASTAANDYEIYRDTILLLINMLIIGSYCGKFSNENYVPDIDDIITAMNSSKETHQISKEEWNTIFSKITPPYHRASYDTDFNVEDQAWLDNLFANG